MSDKTDIKNNIYYRTLKDLDNKASPELVLTLTQYMQTMKENAPPGSHTHAAVQDCTPVLQDAPSTLDVVLICYILNGGVLLKHIEPEPAKTTAQAQPKPGTAKVEDQFDFDSLFNDALDLLDEEQEK